MYLNSVKDYSTLSPKAKDLNISITRKLIISILQTTSRPLKLFLPWVKNNIKDLE